MLDQAEFLASMGADVFPCHWRTAAARCSCGDLKCKNVGKHPLIDRWRDNSSDDPDQIAAWWRKWPDANIAIATGSVSGLWVLDLDLKWDENGVVVCDGLVEVTKFGINISTTEGMVARTGGGGLHVYYRWDKMIPEIRNRQGIMPGVDVRGEGGYVIAPPSRHESGKLYEWISEALAPLEAPPEIVRLALHGVVSNDQPLFAPKLDAPKELPPRIATPLDVEVAEALRFIPPNLGREDWMKVCMALHDASGGSSEGFDLFHDWSASANGSTTPNGNKAYEGRDACLKQWGSLSGKANPIGRRTLFRMAYDRGFTPNTAEIDPSEARDAVYTEAVVGLWRDPEVLHAELRRVGVDLGSVIPKGLEWFQEMTEALAHAFQVPPELPFFLSLPIAMSALSGKAVACVPGEAWKEQAVLWTVVAMKSGSRKSPVWRQLIAPLIEWEAGLDKAGAAGVHEAALFLAEDRVNKLKKDLTSPKCQGNPTQSKTYQSDLAKALGDLERLKSEGVQSDTLLAQDTTSERLVELMQRQQGRVLISASESDPLDVAMGRYTAGEPHLGPWLQGYDGDPLKQERVGHTRIVERPLLNVGVAAQPEALSWLTNEMAQGRGFIARFMMVTAERDVLAEEILAGRGMDDDQMEPWAQALTSLLQKPVPDTPVELVLSPDAVGWLRRFMHETRDIRATNDDDDPWFAKHDGRAIRIAMLYHCMKHEGYGNLTIDGECMRAACDTARYAISQHRTIATMASLDKDTRIAHRLAKQIVNRDLSGKEFPRNEVISGVRGPRSEVTCAADTDGAFQLLIDSNWLRPSATAKSRRGAGGSITWSRYEARPDFHARWEANERSHSAEVRSLLSTNARRESTA